MRRLGIFYDKKFDLNILCRLDFDFRPDDGDVRPSVIERIEKLRVETLKVLLELQQPTREIQRNILSRMVEQCLEDYEQVPQPVIYAEQGHWIFLRALAAMHAMEKAIARNFAYSRPKRSKSPPRRALKESPDGHPWFGSQMQLSRNVRRYTWDGKML